MNEINTAIWFCHYFASFSLTKSCKRIVVTHFFFTRGELHISLDSLKSLFELPDLESEMLTDCLTAQTDAQELSISSLGKYLSESIHFRIRKVIDITWSTTEDEDISIQTNSIELRASYILIILYYDAGAERFHHNTEYIGEIIVKVDNGDLFPEKFWRGFEFSLLTKMKSTEKCISRQLHGSLVSLLLSWKKYRIPLLEFPRENPDITICFVSGLIGFTLRFRCLRDACTCCDGRSFLNEIQMNSADSNSTVEVSVISIDTEDTTIVGTSDILYPSNDFCCFVYRTSSERRRIQSSLQRINSVGSGDDFSYYDIFGVDDSSCLSEKGSFNMSMRAKSGNHLRPFIEEHGEFLSLFFIFHEEIHQSLFKSFLITNFHRSCNRVDSGVLISDSEMPLRTRIRIGMFWRLEESGHVGSSYLEETGEYREWCPLGESCY